MEFSVSKFKYRVFSFLGVVVMISILVMPVAAVSLDANGNEFIDINDYGYFDFSDGSSVYVDCDFPTSWIKTHVYKGNFSGANHIGAYTGEVIKLNTKLTGLHLQINPVGGSNLFTGNSVGTQVKNAHIIDLTGVPSSGSFMSSFRVDVRPEDGVELQTELFNGYIILYFVDENGIVVQRSQTYFPPEAFDDGEGLYSFVFGRRTFLKEYDLPSDVVGFVPVYQLYDANGVTPYTVESISFDGLMFSYEMSALEYEAKQNEKLQDTLDDVKDAMDKQNDKLDDILSGGFAGEDLIAGGDKLEDAGAGLGDDIGAIQDFEDQYMGQLDDNIDEVVAGADLTWLYPSLSFVQHYLNKTIAGVPSKYLIVFTLPMFFGLFMYIVGHPIRAPRPDTSGDEVTRETFSTTQILAGPNAGRLRSTRTVTTSREIGRVHNE